jgi:hypothetical protein
LVSAIISAVLVPVRVTVSRRLLELPEDDIAGAVEVFQAFSMVSTGVHILIHGFAIAGIVMLLGHAKREAGTAHRWSIVALVGLIAALLLMALGYLPPDLEEVEAIQRWHLIVGNLSLLSAVVVLFSTVMAVVGPLHAYEARSFAMIGLGCLFVLQLVMAGVTGLLAPELRMLMWVEFGLGVFARLLTGILLLSAAGHLERAFGRSR